MAVLNTCTTYGAFRSIGSAITVSEVIAQGTAGNNNNLGEAVGVKMADFCFFNDSNRYRWGRDRIIGSCRVFDRLIVSTPPPQLRTKSDPTKIKDNNRRFFMSTSFETDITVAGRRYPSADNIEQNRNEVENYQKKRDPPRASNCRLPRPASLGHHHLIASLIHNYTIIPTMSR